MSGNGQSCFGRLPRFGHLLADHALAGLVLATLTVAPGVSWAQTTIGNSAAASNLGTASLSSPEMLGSLSFNPALNSVDTGPLGKWYIDGVVSGLGFTQSQPTATDHATMGDISNGTVIIQKPEGLIQFFIQAGAYAIPTLGTPYIHTTDSSTELSQQYGAVPQAFLKIEPTKDFSIVAGKLPSLYGAEDTFTFQNFNIARGLLWLEEPTISRGVQVNLTKGAVTASLSLNDGFYSDRLTWLSGLATWAIDTNHALVFVAGSNLSRTAVSTLATPLAQNNSTILNLIFTDVMKPFTLTPSLHLSHVPRDTAVGIGHEAYTYGASMLVSYTFDPNWSIAARGEYFGTTGRGSDPASPNLLFGPGSGAVSATLTPTFIYQHFFARAEASLVHIVSLAAEDGFGSSGTARSQVRGLLEAGVIF